MNRTLDTVAIKSERDPAGYVLINERDFDGDVHERFDPDAPATPSVPAAPVLTDIPGIGPGRAAKLAAAGIETVEAFAAAEPQAIAAALGVSEAGATAWQEDARGLVATP